MTEILTDHEKMLVVSTAVIAFLVGMWFGVWSVPTQALDVPNDPLSLDGEGPPDPAYKPVPTWLMPTSFALVGILVSWIWTQFRDDPDDVDPLNLEAPTDD